MSPANKFVRHGIEVEKRKQQNFFELAKRLRKATDTREATRLGDKLGRLIFGRYHFCLLGTFQPLRHL
jgi:hypothetical protein